MKQTPKSEIEENLKSCRQLGDPVAFTAKLVPLFVACGAIGSTIGIISSSAQLGNTYTVILSVFFSITLIFITWFLFRPFWIIARKPKVIFLRSFSQDRSQTGDKILRNCLRETLPPELSLAGIRAPDIRTSIWLKFILNSYAALKYIGSHQFELEAANRNWFARLLASIQKSRAIIIDLRQLTPLVHDEMCLVATLNAGSNRVFLLGDSSKSEKIWRQQYNEIVAPHLGIPMEATFINIPEEEELTTLEFKRELKDTFSKIPCEPISITQDAYSLVRSKVSSEDWSTPWRETQLAAFLLPIIPILLISYFFFPPVINGIINVSAVILLLVAYILAFGRISLSAFRQKKLGMPSKPGFLTTALSPLPLILFYSAIQLFSSIVSQKLDDAKDLQTIVAAKQFHLALYAYSSDYGHFGELPSEFSSDSAEGQKLLNNLTREHAYLAPNTFTFNKVTKIDQVGFLDSFGNPFRVFLNTQFERSYIISIGDSEFKIRGNSALCSSGKDGILGTEDDVLIDATGRVTHSQ